MKYTLTKRDIAILLGFLGVLALGLVYYFIYLGYKDKTEALEASNNAMQERVDVLQDLVNRQEELIASTKKNNEEAEEIMNKFPADYKYEDAILFGLEMNEIAPFETFQSITFGGAEQIYAFEDVASIASEQVRGYIPDGGMGQGEGEPAEGEGAEGGGNSKPLPVLYRKTNVYNNQTDYSGLKNALAYIIDNTDRSGLNVTAVYDSTSSLLNDNINVMSYYVTGTDKVYEEPQIPTVIKGTDDIFGTLELNHNGENLFRLRGSGEVTDNNSESNSENTANTANSEED